jgi:putative intracellular protease/amidase
VFVELLEEEGALEAHLLDAAVEAQDALARAVVGFFDVVDAAPEIDAFAVVGGFDGRRQVFLRVGAGCWGWVSINRGVDGCGARC